MAATKKKEKKNAMAVINQHISSVWGGEVSREPVQR